MHRPEARSPLCQNVRQTASATPCCVLVFTAQTLVKRPNCTDHRLSSAMTTLASTTDILQAGNERLVETLETVVKSWIISITPGAGLRPTVRSACHSSGGPPVTATTPNLSRFTSLLLKSVAELGIARCPCAKDMFQVCLDGYEQIGQK